MYAPVGIAIEIETGTAETKVVLVDSQGKPIGPDYEILDKEDRSCSPQLSSQAAAFFAALNWLAFRTIFYTLAARNLEIDLILHPIRHSSKLISYPSF
jgi:hypothetical protein